MRGSEQKLVPGLLELRHAAGDVAAGVDDADRAADDRVGLDALLVEVLERADVVRAERRAAAEDEDPLLLARHAPLRQKNQLRRRRRPVLDHVVDAPLHLLDLLADHLVLVVGVAAELHRLAEVDVVAHRAAGSS